MPIQKKTLRAHLIKYREPYLNDFVWFWINPNNGQKLSGDFFTQEEAESWFQEMVQIHDEAMSLIKRAKSGRFYELQAILELERVKINKNCTFEHTIKSTENGENILIARVLGVDLEDAKFRIGQFYDIKEWIDSDDE